MPLTDSSLTPRPSLPGLPPGRPLARAAHRAALAVLSCVAVVIPCVASGQPIADPDSCRAVRLADVGWTDVSATTAVVAAVLRTLGYQPTTTVLSVPITFEALKNGDVDVFLGHWRPSQAGMIAPYLSSGSIELLATNLTGARYTLAVPSYLHDAGLRDFADISRFRGALDARIHGIEAGNDANQILLEMIRTNAAGLGGFQLVESSEQAMLAAVARAVDARAPIVFLAWSPHPMNAALPVRYLTGGDAWFGADFGGATVHTVVRRGYAAACPNAARLLRQVRFTVDEETALMDDILTRRRTPEEAADAWTSAHAARLAEWTRGVAASPAIPGSSGSSAFEATVRRYKLPVGDAATRLVDLMRTRAGWAFNAVAGGLGALVSAVHAVLSVVPPALAIVGATALAWHRRRSRALAVFVPLALMLIVNMGYWAATIETLALVSVAAALSTVIGIPVGVMAARRPALAAALRPVLDLMQTLPTFVYLTPTLVLFGLGVVPGLVSTIVFALPAPIRLTHLGLTSVPAAVLDAADAFGATPWQRLMKVELPMARPAIATGVSQCLMLSLSMVVIAALVGAGGLGVPVVRALNTVQVGMGIEAGLAIVLLAIVLDRLARPATPRDHP